jgi:hypothetical protein
MRLGSGCNGPVVYEIQLCSRTSVNGAKCRSLCESLKPVCKIDDFDDWVKAYNTSGFMTSQLGRNGFKGDLAQPGNTENYDEDGQLLYTSGNAYTVCISSAGPIGPYSSESPVSTTTPKCGTVKVASEQTCRGGTLFNGDPLDPKCVTRDSYCAGGGAIGNFMSTMNAGFQMVAVQNQHYVNAPEQDGNLVIGAVTAGTDLSGEVAPTRFSNPVRPDGQAGSFSTSNPNDQVKGISTASASLGALGSEGVNKNPESTTKKSL